MLSPARREGRVEFGYALRFEGNRNAGYVGVNFKLKYTFGYAFPVEGNRNWITIGCANRAVMFGYAFPFEGNRNSIRRIKSVSEFSFGYAFPVEGNRNAPNDFSTCAHELVSDTPSRLKGIETL